MTEKNKILIVEDELDLSKALGEKLENAGFRTSRAQNGEMALRMLEGDKPDLILLDIVMPVMDGMTMLKKLRSSGEWGAKVPVVILTNLSVDDKIISGVTQMEPSYYLVKTEWTLEDVLKKVKDCLGQ